ncbi:MAG: hypothetical protein K2X50_02165 [Gammaproteobacteria bacterium]|nr:hypothetical protein [Gammaproteobacteria bacterium]
MNDFFAFRRMLAPWLIRVGFIIGSFVIIGVGIYDIFAVPAIGMGIAIILFGPLALRLLLEMFIVFFTMNETLTDIRSQMKQKE